MKIWFLGNPDDNHTTKWIEYFDNRYWFYVVPYFSKILTILINAYRLRRDLKTDKPAILHALYVGVWGMIGALSGFHPFVLTAFGSDILINSKVWWKKPFIRFMLKRADVIICNGEPLERKMIELGVNPEKIRFIHWGQSVDKFKSLKEESFFPTIISMRNLEPVYDIQTLIEAVPLVSKVYPNAKFLIAGQGSEKRKLKKLAEPYKNVKFIGWIPKHKVCRVLNLADVYVSISLSDGDLSQTTQQAMLCEIPIITTNIAVNKKRIRHNINGVLMPVSSPDRLAKEIIRLLNNKRLRKRLGRLGRKLIEKNFNWAKEMSKANNYIVQYYGANIKTSKN